jgi:hypothetical protein
MRADPGLQSGGSQINQYCSETRWHNTCLPKLCIRDYTPPYLCKRLSTRDRASWLQSVNILAAAFLALKLLYWSRRYLTRTKKSGPKVEPVILPSPCLRVCFLSKAQSGTCAVRGRSCTRQIETVERKTSRDSNSGLTRPRVLATVPEWPRSGHSWRTGKVN